jgi:leader peptidase (prepilin peptidase)/N-methyltransferase
MPLLSWLVLRGRCRNCRAWIGWRYPLVELAVGVIWAGLAWQSLPELLDSGLTATLLICNLVGVVVMMIFYWVLVALAVLDAENLWLPDWLTYPGVGLGFLGTLVRAACRTFSPMNDTMETVLHAAGRAAMGSLLAILAAAGLILFIRWVYWLVRHREGIGLGDAKLMALLAAWLGLPGALLAFGLGVVIGALVAVVLLTIPSLPDQPGGWALKKLPLGTFLCVGGVVSGFWGQQIIALYMRWAGL